MGFDSTDGSFVLPHLFHAANNFAFFVLPVLPTAAGDLTGPLWVGVALVVLVAGPGDLSGRRESRTPTPSLAVATGRAHVRTAETAASDHRSRPNDPSARPVPVVASRLGCER